MVEIKLVRNKAFKWHTNSNVSVKGFIYNSKNELIKNEAFLILINSLKSKEETIKFLKKANGTFSFVINKPGFFFVAVDRFRTFPFFYRESGSNISVSDNIQDLFPSDSRIELNKTAEEVFSACSYTLGKNTLIDGIYQLQAGEFLSKKDSGYSTEFYHTLTTPSKSISYEDAKLQCKEIIESLTQKLSTFLEGKEVLLPLSAGLDSRLIALMLKKGGVENVKCFTFGSNKENPEKDRAKRTAENLGFEWHYVDYSKFDKTDFHLKTDFQNFCDYESQYVSKYAFVQYFSAGYLKSVLKATPGSVVLPGHGGDFFSGSHLRPYMKDYKSVKSVVKDLEYIHCNLRKKSRKQIKLCKNEIASIIENSPPLYNQVENWDLKERQAKYIVNSCKLWEYNDFLYFMPLCDNEFMDFFSALPFELRLYQKLYRAVVKDLFNEFNIDFVEDVAHFEPDIMQKVKVFIKRKLPFLRKRTDLFQYDFSDFKTTSKPIMKELEKYGRVDDMLCMNSILTEWYLLGIKKKHKLL